MLVRKAVCHLVTGSTPTQELTSGLLLGYSKALYQVLQLMIHHGCESDHDPFEVTISAFSG
jgi:hypothetical protein